MVSVVLLGAGASFGSEEPEIKTPPLGDKLFEHLEMQDGVTSQIPDEIKQIFRENFERGMAKYYEYTKGNVMTFQRELAHYLAKYESTPKSSYIALIKALGTKRVIYSSLNYDLLFELSAASINLNTHYGVDQNDHHVRLIKPHGSSNFWPDIPIRSISGVSIINPNGVDIQAPIKTLNRDETLRRCMSEDSLAPAMAVYSEGKKVKISPDFTNEQQNIWDLSIKNAKNVFITGVRINKTDSHIWEKLSQSKANITYFGLRADHQDFLEWKNTSNKKNLYYVESNFANCINIIHSRIKYQ